MEGKMEIAHKIKINGIKAVVTDIEGTTTPISFVKNVLFLYSKKKLADFLRRNWNKPHVKEIIEDLSMRIACNLDMNNAISLISNLIDTDRKETPLKELQGLIWEEGYISGDIKGRVYSDAYDVLRDWKSRGISIYVFSSGSVRAQRLLFSHTQYGDMTHIFSGYFDTKVGGKCNPESYRKISQIVGYPPHHILFLSDVEEELDSAAEAGMKTIRFLREEDYPNMQNIESKHPVVHSFYEIEIE